VDDSLAGVLTDDGETFLEIERDEFDTLYRGAEAKGKGFPVAGVFEGDAQLAFAEVGEAAEAEVAGEIGFGGNGIGFVAGGVGGEEFAEARDAPKAASLAGSVAKEAVQIARPSTAARRRGSMGNKASWEPALPLA